MRQRPDAPLPLSFYLRVSASYEASPFGGSKRAICHAFGLSPVGKMFPRFGVPERSWEFAPSAEASAPLSPAEWAIINGCILVCQSTARIADGHERSFLNLMTGLDAGYSEGQLPTTEASVLEVDVA